MWVWVRFPLQVTHVNSDLTNMFQLLKINQVLMKNTPNYDELLKRRHWFAFQLNLLHHVMRVPFIGELTNLIIYHYWFRLLSRLLRNMSKFAYPKLIITLFSPLVFLQPLQCIQSLFIQGMLTYNIDRGLSLLNLISQRIQQDSLVFEYINYLLISGFSLCRSSKNCSSSMQPFSI